MKDHLEDLIYEETAKRLEIMEQPEALRRGFAGSLLTLAARENGTLVGLLRAVGDGCTVVLVQDLLVRPDHQRRGIGTALMQAALERFRSVRQVQLLTTRRKPRGSTGRWVC